MFMCIVCMADLHSVIGWSAAALRANPVDVLRIVLDITSLAVNAVLSVNYQSLTLLAIFSWDILVNT